MTPDWAGLISLAEAAVAEVMAELPPEVRAEANQVPVLFLEVCEDDPEILGQYGNFEEGEVSAARGPILLFLLAIRDYCEDENLEFSAEVQVTYMHELGHHLGWDEGDVEERGLE